MSFEYKNQRLAADQIPLEKVASHYGTPCYVYSASQIESNFLQLKQAFDDHLPGHPPLIAYACKANSTLAVLSTLARLGAGADIVSGGEMTRALTAGIPASKIVFSGVGKTHDEIAMAIDHDIAQINIESEAEMEAISKIAHQKKKNINVSFRMNPDVDAKTNAKITTGKKDSKFGLAPNIIRTLYKKAHEDQYLKPVGLSVHIGSQLVTLDPFQKAFQLVADFAKDLQEQGLSIETLDLGGGIGIVYEQEHIFCLKDYIKIIQDLIIPIGAKIILEPGRSLTGNTGLLLCKVLYYKNASGKHFLIVDAGMTDFMRPSLYDAIHPILPIQQTHGPTKIYDIAGPVCETTDILAKNVELPVYLEQEGQLIAFMQAGAYGSVMASFYNARPTPPEIITKKTANGPLMDEIRSRISVQDVIKTEKVPDWLEK